MTRRAVPRLVALLFALAAPASARDSLLADLEEEATVRAARDGRALRPPRGAGASSPDRSFRSSVNASPSCFPPLWRTCMLFWRRLPHDLAFATRRLAQTPAFTVTCVLTLALGIGGTTAMFTLIQQVLLNPLPVHRPAELYRLGDSDNCCVVSGLQGAQSLYSYDLYRHLRDNTAGVRRPGRVPGGQRRAQRPPAGLRDGRAVHRRAGVGELLRDARRRRRPWPRAWSRGRSRRRRAGGGDRASDVGAALRIGSGDRRPDDGDERRGR